MEFRWHGRKVYLNGFSDSDWIYSQIRDSRSFYEIDLLRYIKYAMRGKSAGCILDIGANIGNHSVFFGMYVSDKVVSFEPNPDVFPTLIRNIASNGVKCRPYQLALGDREAVARVKLPSEFKNNIGAAKLVEIHSVKDGSIRVATLDRLLPEIEEFANGLTIVAMKIDVEGMEPAVLRGAKLTLTKYMPDLFIEISSTKQMEEVKSIIVPIGYVPIVAWAGTPVWHFVHREKSSRSRMLRLHAYIILFKEVKALLRGIIYGLGLRKDSSRISG